MWLCEYKLKEKTAHFRLSSAFQKRACLIKDGAYYCYCAYVLRIYRYSDFLSPMLTNTGIFLRGLKLYGVRTLVVQKENGGSHAFLRDN